MTEMLYSRGFAVHQKYEEIVRSQCNADERDSLDVYWEEMAREFICSAGRANSIQRSFPDRGAYRSAYLDSLATDEFDNSLGLAPISFHPCEQKFALRKREDRQFMLNITPALEEFKRQECQQHKIDGSLWDGTKMGARLCFERLLIIRGFSKVNKSFVKKSPSGLFLTVNIDTGGKRYCLQLPIYLSISTDKNLTDFFPLSLPKIIEGVWYYSIFKSAETAVLGVGAYVEMIDILSDSFVA